MIIPRAGLLRRASGATLVSLMLLGQTASSFVHECPSLEAATSMQARTTFVDDGQWNTATKIFKKANSGSITQCHQSLPSDRRTMLKQIVQPSSSLVTATASTVGMLVATKSSKSNAMSPEEAATAYDSYASTYNDLDGGSAASMLGINEARNRLLGQAKGHVLELAVGTGLNLDSYNPQQLSSLTLVDISDGMLKEAKSRFDALNGKSNNNAFQGVPVKFVKADATSQLLVELFGERAFDTVVDTFSLCVFGNEGAKKCLEQVRKLVKPENAGGKDFNILV